MASQFHEDKSVPQIFLQPHSTASDDLERLSTLGNVGLLRSMSARTVDSLPGVESSHNSSGSGSRYFLSPCPGMDRSGESMTARSTSCPSMAYASGQTIPHGYHPFSRANNDDEDDINLEGEVITDLPMEATRLFPELIPQLGLNVEDPVYGRDCDNGNVSHVSYQFPHVQQHPSGSAPRTTEQDPRVDPASLPGSFPMVHGHQNHRTRDYGTNPDILHREAPVFAQSHSHNYRAISRSNGHHGDIPEYNYIRYHRQTTKDTDSTVDAHRTSGYHRQSTKDSSTSMGEGYSGNRRSGRRRSGKHSSTSSSSQRYSSSSQTSGGEHAVAPSGGGCGGGEMKPDRVINIRDLPSSIAKEVIAEKSHMDSNFNVDVQEKCIRWLNTLHVSAHDS